MAIASANAMARIMVEVGQVGLGYRPDDAWRPNKLHRLLNRASRLRVPAQ